MGMYTELVLAVELKADTPQDVIDTLMGMVQGYGINSNQDHLLFSTDRWQRMLNSGSAYFAGKPHSELVYDYYGCINLTIRTNLKNYDGEIEHFLDWIKPYVYERGFAGYKRYEECSEPTLIYFGDRD